MLKYIVLSVIVTQYFVGSVGFTVHHCCCKKLYHTSACLTDIFFPYEIHNCLKKIEDASSGKQLTFRPYRHCGTYTYSMDYMKYNCQKKVPAPPLYLVLMQNIALLNSIPKILDSSDQISKFRDHYSQVYKRRWCEPDRLCLFII